MSYITTPNLVTVAMVKHGEVVECSGTGFVYADLVWLGTQVLEATLLSSQIELFKEQINAKINEDAEEERQARLKETFGFTCINSLRTLDYRYAEASAYLVDNQAATPMLDAEISHTGETKSTLASSIVSDYDSDLATLQVKYGHIMGVLRSEEATVNAYTTLAQLEAYAGPTWSY